MRQIIRFNFCALLCALMATPLALPGALAVEMQIPKKDSPEEHTAVHLPAPESVSAAQALIIGRILLHEKRQQQAMPYLNKAVAEQPGYEAFFYRAEANAEIDDFAAAKRDYDEALKTVPDNLRSAVKQGIAQMAVMQGHYDEGLAIMRDVAKDVSKKVPNNTTVLKSIAATFEMMGRDEDALKTLNEAIHIDAKDADLYARRAEVEKALGNSQASSDYEKAADLATAPEEHAMYKAQVYAINNQFKEAMTELNAAVHMAPKYYKTWLARAKLKSLMNDRAGALEDVAQAVGISPDNEGALVLQAELFYGEGRTDKAKENIDLVFRGTPTMQTAYYLRAAVLVDKEPEEALKLVNSAIERFPKYATLYDLRALLRAQKQDYAGAEADYTESLRLCPSFVSYMWRGSIYAQTDKWKEAADDFAQALQRSSGTPDPLLVVRAAYAYAHVGRFAEVEKLLDKALAAEPRNAKLQMIYALTMRTMKKPNEAINAISRAVELDPENFDYALQKADWLLDEKRYKEADVAYDYLIKHFPNKPTGYDGQAWLARLRNDWPQVVALSTEAIKRKGDNAQYYALRAFGLRGLGQDDQAISDLDKAIALSGKNPNDYVSRACLLLSRGESNLALKDAIAACKLANNGSSRWMHGICEYSLKRWEPAKNDFLAASDRAMYGKVSNHEYARLWVFLTLLRMGKADEAKTYLTSNPAVDPWVRSLQDYMLGRMSDEQLIALAKKPSELTEAHAYIGMMQQIQSGTFNINDQIKWVADQGTFMMYERDFCTGVMHGFDKDILSQELDSDDGTLCKSFASAHTAQTTPKQ